MSVNLLAGALISPYQTGLVTEVAMAGLYLEEFVVGQVIRHALTRSVTESDNVLFSVMT